jgi:hypothetical protein
MNALAGLPENVERLIRSAHVCEFSTMSAAGVPIDTPTLSFYAPDLSSIDVATGLAYPAKAERVRRNHRVGLLFEGVLPGEPVVSIVGMGATTDSDIKANALRYISEVGAYGAAADLPWAEEYQAVWYWARILMKVAPVEILWWDGPDALDAPPKRWDAPAGTHYPASDPAPKSPGTAAPKWPITPWRELAEQAMGRAAPGHLSLVDENGFPRPMRAHNLKQTPDGFTLDIGKGAPWARSGKAFLTFQGRESFVGEASPEGAGLRLKVERSLPILPLTGNPNEVFKPQAATREALMGRLTAELGRRGQQVPVIPQDKPQPTAGALMRAARWHRVTSQGKDSNALLPRSEG